MDVWLLWNLAEDEYGSDEVISVHAREEGAVQALTAATADAYRKYTEEARRLLATAEKNVARMADIDIAYFDWQLAARYHPTKAGRVLAHEIAKELRAHPGRGRPKTYGIDPFTWTHDYREDVDELSERSAWTHDEWLGKADSGYTVTVMPVEP